MTFARRRLTVDEVDDVTIATFNDRRLLDSCVIEEVGREMVALLEQDQRKKVVLNLRNVSFMSSAMLGKLILFDKKAKCQGAQHVFCGISREIYQNFAITRLNKIYHIVDSEEEAIAWFDHKGWFGGGSGQAKTSKPSAAGSQLRQVACPIDRCTGSIEFSIDPLQAGQVELTCLDCSSRIALKYLPAQGERSPAASVVTCEIPTYENESVCIAGAAPGAARYSIISVHGRLDLFASEIVERAWNSLPLPRQVLFDLRTATDLTDAGSGTVLRFATNDGNDGSCACLLVTGEQRNTIAAFSQHPPVHADEPAAMEVMKKSADASQPEGIWQIPLQSPTG